MSNIIVLPQNTSVADFNAQVNKCGGLVFVDFYATWCPPCQRLIQEIPNFAKEYPKTTFIKINVEENEAIAQKFNVSSIPHVAFMKPIPNSEPQLLDTQVGFNVAKLKASLSQYQ